MVEKAGFLDDISDRVVQSDLADGGPYESKGCLIQLQQGHNARPNTSKAFILLQKGTKMV